MLHNYHTEPTAKIERRVRLAPHLEFFLFYYLRQELEFMKEQDINLPVLLFSRHVFS